MNDKPQQLCTLVILRKNHELLLAMKKRGFGVGKWNGAGGKMKNRESLEDCLIRECEEEIGIKPIEYKKVAIHDFINQNVDNPILQQTHVYFCDQWEGEPEETAEMSPQWFHVWEIPYDHMWEDDALWLPMVLAGKRLRCKFYFDEEGSLSTAQINILKELK